jgi:hypothetical protein
MWFTVPVHIAFEVWIKFCPPVAAAQTSKKISSDVRKGFVTERDGKQELKSIELSSKKLAADNKEALYCVSSTVDLQPNKNLVFSAESVGTVAGS